MKLLAGLSKWGASGLGRRLLLFALVTLMSVGTMTEFVVASEGTALVRPKLGVFPEGEITGVGTSTLEIAGLNYRLHPKLIIVADQGQQLELKQLRVGLVVQYHQTEGALDQVIVIVPR